jgi:hypothetical protein
MTQSTEAQWEDVKRTVAELQKAISGVIVGQDKIVD